MAPFVRLANGDYAFSQMTLAHTVQCPQTGSCRFLNRIAHDGGWELHLVFNWLSIPYVAIVLCLIELRKGARIRYRIDRKLCFFPFFCREASTANMSCMKVTINWKKARGNPMRIVQRNAIIFSERALYCCSVFTRLRKMAKSNVRNGSNWRNGRCWFAPFARNRQIWSSIEHRALTTSYAN